MSRLRALLACPRGTAAVEFAIVAGLLVALCVAIMDFGRAYYINNQVSYLADRAVRRILIEPQISGAALDSDLRAAFSAGDPASLTIGISTDMASGTPYRVVTIGFPVSLFIPGLASDTVALSVTRRVPAG